MARLLFILIAVAACVALVVILHALWTAITQAGRDRLSPASGITKGQVMASSGIQKAAYIALIVVLFGAASGWLGGL
ncbi:hypothetical protein HKX54_07760 [Sulfitobacter sp. M57]|uniref:hypothetical protein n=1 Tax=unclassified Sulfitobacter TaxID=196795 RepID=UPI0023E2375E|nr:MULTISPECIES: hypothetical protein [unclassified Sulfitobacter]MDF3414348.1 hypothetical protein [Sulfitobacter sp. KE5]MDF3420370.1 hypothetical protein [Sulfitobacter sp. KE43]MDF3432894.1 hypothetical protein [Sulfitobacter sp. KE42]MDF3458534.1 hypothetical protein [Sulfitobacter sp. S74]MDF3462434.1 hypothetical protein [Sulfitobacter sp. Ks18]